MATSLKQVRAALDVEEPDYPTAAQLGTEAIPHLKRLVETAEPLLASKAAYLASLISSEQAVEVIKAAARHRDASVRVAAAAGAGNLVAKTADPTLQILLGDADPGVRKTALSAVHGGAGEAVCARVEQILRQETDPVLRELSQDALARAAGRDESYTTPRGGSDDGAGYGGGDLQGAAPFVPDVDARARAVAGEDGGGGGGGGSFAEMSESDGEGWGGGELPGMGIREALQSDGSDMGGDSGFAGTSKSDGEGRGGGDLPGGRHA